ncbi:MAG: MATE family efflux transporter [Dermatophilaceae bacterium]
MTGPDSIPGRGTRRERWLGTPEFRSEALSIAFPITLQSVIMAILLMTDQIMVGQLGDVAIASVGVASKLTAIVTVVLAALSTAVSIMAAQLWGKRNAVGLRRLLGFALATGLPLAGLCVALVGVAPSLAMSPFTADERLLSTGSSYLSILALSYLPTMVTLILSGILRGAGQVRVPMYAGIAAIAINLVLNYGLIFGNLGMPELGLAGSAIGTSIAKAIELLIIIVFVYATKSPVAVRGVSQLVGMPKAARRSLAVMFLPLVGNDLLWVLGETAYAVVYGRLGVEQFAAMTVSFPLQSLGIGLLTGLSGAAAILVGHRVGRDDFDEAAQYGTQLLRSGMVIGAGVGAIAALLAPLYVSAYSLSPEVRQVALQCVLVFCLFLFVKVGNMIVIDGVLNAGGDTRYTFVMGTAVTWLLGVPAALVAAFVFDLSIPWVYAILSLEEVVRLGFSIRRLRGDRWARNLVHHHDPVETHP